MCRLGMSADSVTHVEREKTKRVVYAVIYGVGKLHTDSIDSYM